MTAVIYARYSTDSQREESIEGQTGSAPPMRRRMASQWSSTTLTVPFLQKRTTAHSSSR